MFIDSKHNFIQRTDLNIKATESDSVFIEIPDIVGFVYKPDYVNYEDFIFQIEVALNTITKEKKRGFIMGDLNINLLKYNHNHQVNTFVNLMYSYSLFPCIDRPTRVYSTKNGTTISLIDNIFTNNIEHKITSGNLVTDLSDHFPNFVSIKGSCFDNKTKPLNKLTRQLKANNIKGFKNYLSLVNWDYNNSDDNPETSYSNFLNKTTELLNIHCPLKSIKVSNRKSVRKPWVTTSFLKSIRTKDKLYKKFISKPTTENKLK